MSRHANDLEGSYHISFGWQQAKEQAFILAMGFVGNGVCDLGRQLSEKVSMLAEETF
jgi:hypothetical protein